MPYTLSMALLWVAFAVLLGIVIGWLMRSVVAKRQIERARSNHLDNVELERLRGRIADLEVVTAERDRFRDELDACRSAAETPPAPVTPTAVTPTADTPTAVNGAEAQPGAPFTRDDLTAIEGIGPNIAELCTGIGIQTWHDLAQTEVSLLRTMLDDAGPRFKSHDPTTWPEQAALLAAGHWTEFRELTAGLDRGRPAEGRPVE